MGRVRISLELHSWEVRSKLCKCSSPKIELVVQKKMTEELHEIVPADGSTIIQSPVTVVDKFRACEGPLHSFLAYGEQEVVGILRSLIYDVEDQYGRPQMAGVFGRLLYDVDEHRDQRRWIEVSFWRYAREVACRSAAVLEEEAGLYGGGGYRLERVILAATVTIKEELDVYAENYLEVEKFSWEEDDEFPEEEDEGDGVVLMA